MQKDFFGKKQEIFPRLHHSHSVPSFHGISEELFTAPVVSCSSEFPCILLPFPLASAPLTSRFTSLPVDDQQPKSVKTRSQYRITRKRSQENRGHGAESQNHQSERSERRRKSGAAACRP